MNKKIYALSGVVMLMGIAFTGCKEDTQPRVSAPTDFVLNKPPMMNYLYDLVSNEDQTIDITVSQPDYGVAIVPTYTVDMSLTGEFTEEYNKEEKTGDYTTLYGTWTSAKIQIPAEMFCVGTTMLLGYTDKAEEPSYTAPTLPVYLRVTSTVNNWPAGTITSNVIELPKVRPFFKLREPGVIYFIGQANGWNIDADDMPLTEDENGIGSKIYYGTYEISDEDAKSGFRFYTQLGSWDAEFSIAAGVPDFGSEEVEINDDGIYEGEAVSPGQTNWSITNWPGGPMRMTVNLNNMTVVFQTVDD